jgi:hypothetical protein
LDGVLHCFAFYCLCGFEVCLVIQKIGWFVDGQHADDCTGAGD